MKIINFKTSADAHNLVSTAAISLKVPNNLDLNKLQVALGITPKEMADLIRGLHFSHQY